MPDPLDCARARIRAVIAGSPVPEDPRHAENTVEWLLRLDPQADPALQLAALAHDIERARPDRLRREDFADYDAFKGAHAARGAEMLRRILSDCGVDEALVEETCRLVERHEFGGDARADRLREADSLSYFEVNLPLYYAREGWDEALRRCRWGIRRLSPHGVALLRRLQMPTAELQDVLRAALAAEMPESTRGA